MDSFLSHWAKTANEILAKREVAPAALKVLTAHRMKLKYNLKESATDLIRRQAKLRAKKVERQDAEAKQESPVLSGLRSKIADAFGYDPTHEPDPPPEKVKVVNPHADRVREDTGDDGTNWKKAYSRLPRRK